MVSNYSAGKSIHLSDKTVITNLLVRVDRGDGGEFVPLLIIAVFLFD